MWFQLQIENSQQHEVEAISEFLEENESVSITLTDKFDNPVLEPEPGTAPLWPDVVITALFSDELALEQVINVLKVVYPHLSFAQSKVEDKQWERVWMDDFKPQQFGNRLWICPSWATPPDANAVNLILDPGLAFGTGSHPTTHICLSWLDESDLQHKIVIDYGCGSGILGLAAVKLGASKVIGVDIDEQALWATRQNADFNQITPEQLVVGLPDTITGTADILIANILLKPLLALRNDFYSKLPASGLLVVSGILEEQVEELVIHYQGYFHLLSSKSMDGWSLLVFNRG